MQKFRATDDFGKPLTLQSTFLKRIGDYILSWYAESTGNTIRSEFYIELVEQTGHGFCKRKIVKVISGTSLIRAQKEFEAYVSNKMKIERTILPT